MQTFLPYRDFTRSSQVLDSPRLGKQRVETLQVLRALELGEYGWRSHPVVKMWRGRTAALVLYGLENVRAWRERGHADSTYDMILEFAPEVETATQADLAADGLLPAWLGDGRVHVSHRSALVRKDADFYRPVFGDVPDDLPYHWPDGDETASAGEVEGEPLWIVRAPTADAAQAFLEGGFVGVPEAPPRSAKSRRQVEAFVEQVEVGDLVALPVDGGAHLVLGEVTGAHRELPGPPDLPELPGLPDGRGLPDDGPDLPDVPALVGTDAVLQKLRHRRDVRWHGEVPRAAVRPPAQLQDPRSLFRVRLSESAAAVPGRPAG
ncbi:MAG TPA: MSMEG_6728 family protein [Kineosporiaceae bacterium]|nr:MSMEG_6728 family protein [Kineosporiaceae bacterium]